MGIGKDLGKYSCTINTVYLKNISKDVISSYYQEHSSELDCLHLIINTDIVVAECANNSFELLFTIKNNKENTFKAVVHFKEYLPCYQLTIMNITKDDINMKYSLSPFITTNCWDCFYKFMDYFVNLVEIFVKFM